MRRRQKTLRRIRENQMTDIPEKAVEAAARELAGSETDGNYRWHWHTEKATRILAAILPHLASTQPQPSEYDLLRAITRASEEACAAAIDECEAIALEYGSAIIADAIAALKRGPVAEESGE